MGVSNSCGRSLNGLLKGKGKKGNVRESDDSFRTGDNFFGFREDIFTVKPRFIGGLPSNLTRVFGSNEVKGPERADNGPDSSFMPCFIGGLPSNLENVFGSSEVRGPENADNGSDSSFMERNRSIGELLSVILMKDLCFGGLWLSWSCLLCGLAVVEEVVVVVDSVVVITSLVWTDFIFAHVGGSTNRKELFFWQTRCLAHGHLSGRSPCLLKSDEDDDD